MPLYKLNITQNYFSLFPRSKRRLVAYDRCPHLVLLPLLPNRTHNASTFSNSFGKFSFIIKIKHLPQGICQHNQTKPKIDTTRLQNSTEKKSKMDRFVVTAATLILIFVEVFHRAFKNFLKVIL